MTPTLAGRIQTRLVLLLLVGLPWTVLVTPLLPGGGGVSLVERYEQSLAALGVLALLAAVVWEPLYHLLQQTRWEKDWPSLFALLVVVPEALVLRIAVDGAPLAAFTWHVATTWMVVWLATQGPVRVVHLRWRFRGGRFLT